MVEEEFAAKVHLLKDDVTYLQRLHLSGLRFPSAHPANELTVSIELITDQLLSLMKKDGLIRQIHKQRKCSNEIDSVSADVNTANLLSNIDTMYGVVSSLVDLLPAFVQQSTQQPQQQAQQHQQQQIPGIKTFACKLLHLLTTLVPFLPSGQLQALPDLIISAVSLWPQFLIDTVITTLCENILPYIFGTLTFKDHDPSSYLYLSTPTLIMTILQHTSDNISYAQRVVYTLMSLKYHVSEDLLAVISYGPIEISLYAAEILLHFWPLSLYDQNSETCIDPWESVTCQTVACLFSGSLPAIKMNLNPASSVNLGSKPPPLYMCNKCSRKHSDLTPAYAVQETLSKMCENMNCNSLDRKAVSTCFTWSCTQHNKNRPIRLCAACNDMLHSNLPTSGRHFVQELQSKQAIEGAYSKQLIVAITRLLLEVDRNNGVSRITENLVDFHNYSLEALEKKLSECIIPNEAILRSKYGVLLLINMRFPNDAYTEDEIGRLLAAVLQWYYVVSLVPEENSEQSLKQLKRQFVVRWLIMARDLYSDTFVACLKPVYPDFVRVGMEWNQHNDQSVQYRHTLNRLLCLLPEKIVDESIWEIVMPEWMEVISFNLSADEVQLVQSSLRKLFNPDVIHMFSGNYPYAFISNKFNKSSIETQYHALNWLQSLSRLDILLAPSWLIKTFTDGIKADLEGRKPRYSSTTIPLEGLSDNASEVCKGIIKLLTLWEATQAPDIYILAYEKPIGNYQAASLELDIQLSCFILMLDVIVKQIHLYSSHVKGDLELPIAENLLKFIDYLFVRANASIGDHHSADHSVAFRDCSFCKSSLMLYILAHEALAKVSFVKDKCFRDLNRDESVCKSDSRDSINVISNPIRHKIELYRKRGASFNENEAHSSKVDDEFRKTKQFYLNKRVMALSFKEKSSCKSTMQQTASDSTSNGVEDLLQLIKTIALDLQQSKNLSIVYYQLKCIKLLLPFGEYLSLSNNGILVRELIIKYLLSSLWSLLKFDSCQVVQACTVLLVNCLSFVQVGESFRDIVDKAFKNCDWSERYNTVTKVIAMTNFLNWKDIVGSSPLQSTLAFVFSKSISMLYDSCTLVKIVAFSGFKNMCCASTKVVSLCLHHHYMNCVEDRPEVLLHLEELQKCLPESGIIRSEQFLHWFDALPVGLEPSDFARRRSWTFDNTFSSMHRSETKASLGNQKFRFKKISDLSSHPFKPLSLRRSSSGHCSSTRRHSSVFSASSYEVAAVESFSTNASFHFSELSEFHTSKKNFERSRSQCSNNSDSVVVRDEIIHRLILLFMQYLVKPKLALKDKSEEQEYNMKILDGMKRLMGFDPCTRSFVIASAKLRSSLLYKAFLSEIPLMLDTSVDRGKLLIPFIIHLLHHCTYIRVIKRHTLLALCQPDRQLWLLTLQIILYKYQIADSETIMNLIDLCIQMVEAANHSCPEIDTEANLMGQYVKSMGEVNISTQEDIKSSIHPLSSNIDTSIVAAERATDIVSTREIDDGLSSSEKPKFINSLSIESEQGQDNANFRGVARTSARAKGTLRRERSFEEELGSEATTMAKSIDYDTSTLRKTRKGKNRKGTVNEHPAKVVESKYIDDAEKGILNIRKCIKCGELVQGFDLESICLGVLSLSTFVYRYPDLAASKLLRIMQSVARIASWNNATFDNNYNSHELNHPSKVSNQVLKCILLQYHPNGIFPQLFKSVLNDRTFLPTMANLLSDFSEFDQMEPLYKLFENINNTRVSSTTMMAIIQNLADYMENLSFESYTVWQGVMPHFDTFFRKLPAYVKTEHNATPLFRVMISLLKSQSSTKGLLQAMGHCFSVAIRNASFSIASLKQICVQCYCSFSKEREKLYFVRCAITELVQALKLKITLPATNFIVLAQLLCSEVFDSDTDSGIDALFQSPQANALEAFRQYLPEAVEFLGSTNVNVKVEDLVSSKSVMVSKLKIIIAKILSHEITTSNHNRDSKASSRIVPWLSQRQAPPIRFQLHECVSQVRSLCWLLLGSLHHYFESSSTSCTCMPFTPADNVIVIERVLNVFNAIGSKVKDTAEHLSAIPPTLVLCQLWTIYCEQYMNGRWQLNEFSYSNVIPALVDFWQEVTSAILQIVSEARELPVYVIGQYLTTVENLKESESCVFYKFFPSWIALLREDCVRTGQMDRLRQLQSYNINVDRQNTDAFTVLKKWLNKLQLQMAQNELQATMNISKLQLLV